MHTYDAPLDTGEHDAAQAAAAAIGHRPLAEIGRRAILHHLKKLRKSAPVVREGTDIEGVHDMRVATRSLRATLEMLEETPAFDAGQLHDLRRRLRRLAQHLGEVRDLDVFLDRVATFEGSHPTPPGGLRALRDILRKRRARANKRLLKELDRARTHRLLDELRWLAHHASGRGAAAPALVRQFAGSVIWRRYEAVLAFEAAIPDATPKTLHMLRIAGKRLRYVLELIDAADAAETHPALAVLHDAQDHLGTLHDDVVALQTVAELRAGRPHDDALTTYGAILAAERDSLCASVGPLWERLSGPPMRRQLTGFIAAL
jgi:CHAD domain-containing protein